MEATAKDIQRILNMTRSRYEYLATRADIEPAQRNDGRGRAHLYGYGNVMEFAIADRLGNDGFTPYPIRTALVKMKAFDTRFCAGIFTQGAETGARFYVLNFGMWTVGVIKSDDNTDVYSTDNASQIKTALDAVVTPPDPERAREEYIIGAGFYGLSQTIEDMVENCYSAYRLNIRRVKETVGRALARP